jgi:hypothetical protein
MLNDCICRKCSVIATRERLAQEADRLERIVLADPQASVSKKRRAKEARKLELKVRASLEHGRLEEDMRGIKLEKVFSRASTKQAMIARVYLLQTIVYTTLTSRPASTRARAPSQSLAQLWPICDEELNTNCFSRDTGPHSIHDFW